MMTIYNDLRLKAMVRKVANASYLTQDDKILAYIEMFEHEPKDKHTLIKTYIDEFPPEIWKEFNIEDTKEYMTNIIKNVENTNNKDVFSELLGKVKGD